MSKIYTVGIVGGGVSGTVTALELAKYKIDSILFEQKESLVNGPPFCHLHAGGNLYPEISDEQCKMLMLQSIEMARLFPQSIDQRPTLIAVPLSEKDEVAKIKNRLDILTQYYKQLIAEDPANEVLGSPSNYYSTFTQEDLAALAKQESVKQPSSHKEWLTNAIKLIDFELLKTPVFMVQEFGWNLFRLGAQAQLALQQTDACCLKTNTEVTQLKDVRNQNLDYNWKISTDTATYKVKYLVNAGGFKARKLDALLQLHCKQLIEYKAAYIAKWQPVDGLMPELIFHGERGSTHGMVQLTPYSDNYYQIHGMTKDITLFENGLIQYSENSLEAEFDEDIRAKINRNWPTEEIKSRTENAINYVAHFVPSFKSAEVGGSPLHGAQQVPGNDLSLRVGEVCFPHSAYARCQIVKASSALTVARQIVDKLEEEQIIPAIANKSKQNAILDSISTNDIDKQAGLLATQRAYPEALSRLVIKR